MICHICGKPASDMHHIFGGSNRKNSEKHRLKVPLCRECHDKIHFKDRELMDKLHVYGQRLFNTLYPQLDFRAIFRTNYLDDYKETL